MIFKIDNKAFPQGKCANLLFSCSIASDSFVTSRTEPARLLCPWDSPFKHTEVGCHFLLQGIFLTQGLNLGLLYCRQILYHLSHQEIPFNVLQ